MTNEQETLYMMALTRTPRLNVMNQHLLLEQFGSATQIYENQHDLRAVWPEAHENLKSALSGMEQQLVRAEQELSWAQSKRICVLTFNDERYPVRLHDCPDAPLVLYYRGNADLNVPHIVSMVGTRQCSEYGKELCRQYIKDLQRLCPDVMVTSGLAYGIDIHSHRAALQEGLPTVGVLAHGLDQIYPRLHKETAIEMLSQGGLLTEYMSGTAVDKMNFVARNRIVAGMADVTIVVESAAKGGSLITARIAADYNREVMAFPGRISDKASEGCNMLIAKGESHLLTSAQDTMDLLGWTTAQEQNRQRSKGIQTELFQNLTPEEQLVLKALGGSDGLAINQLSIDTNTSVGQLSALLFNMEMRGLVRMLNGGRYKAL